MKPKTMRRLAAGGLVSLSLFSALTLRSVLASTATLPIMVRLIRAIEVTVATSLDFGTLAMSPEEAGKAHMDPGLNRLILDDRNSLALAGGVPKVGRLVVRGAAFPVAISIEENNIVVISSTRDLSTGSIIVGRRRSCKDKNIFRGFFYRS